MRSLLVLLAYLVPTGLAVSFMMWVFFNLCRQSLRRPAHRR